MKIRFLADADLNHDVVKGVLRREPGIDFRTAAGGELRGLNDREVLTLATWSGLSESELARSLGIPPGTLKSRLSRARRKLAERSERVQRPSAAIGRTLSATEVLP